MSRIAAAIDKARAGDRAALITYLMPGDPSLEESERHMLAALEHADILEIGVPFSDPVADGPVIERAGLRALASGTTLSDVLSLVKRLRAASDKPLVLMTYFNPVYLRGVDRFAQDAADAGVDGVILPDVPLEESDDIGAALAAQGIDLIQLASPATPDERMARLAKATRGFLYLVSSFGVTGARKDLAPETLELVKRAKSACGDAARIAVGFGVSEPRHARLLADAGADGVIVGSAIVGRIEQGAAPGDIGAVVRSLRDA